MRHLVRLVTFVIGLLLAACSGNGDQPSSLNQPAAESQSHSVDAAHGKQLFVAYCAACHGPNGEGVRGLGQDMQHSEFVAGLSDDKLVALIKKGRPAADLRNTTGIDMPPKGGQPALTDGELLEIVAHIRSIQQ